ncbi:hypothetical protein ACTXMB_09950 [Arthrobacter rhombi]
MEILHFLEVEVADPELVDLAGIQEMLEALECLLDGAGPRPWSR